MGEDGGSAHLPDDGAGRLCAQRKPGVRDCHCRNIMLNPHLSEMKLIDHLSEISII